MHVAITAAAGALALSLPAAEPRPSTGAPVELPPMMVEESVSSVPWLYVKAGGTEFLSRCSESTTRRLVEGWLAKMQLVRVLVPPEFLAQMDVPSVFVLYAQDLRLTVSAEIQHELQGAETGGAGVNIAPSMRLTDRDMHASIAYIDEALFDAAMMSISPNHVRYLLSARVPEFPAWLLDGVERTFQGADFIAEPITLRPLVWIDSRESSALARDPSHPRALLSIRELFAPDAMRAAEGRHPRRLAARASGQELLYRWALTSGGATRSAFWQLAARAAEGPVTDEVVEACFGLDASELRDRLSDYLPRAVNGTTRIAPGRLPPLPRIEVERATPNEIARLRGEWERLAIAHVQRRLPQVREPYIAQARRTLRRAYDAGDRDPRLLATMGFCELEAGNDEGARELLELAVSIGVVRPRAHYELARLRFAALERSAPAEKPFSYTELAPVFQPLQRALTQVPVLPEVVSLLAEAWVRCEMTPNAAEFTQLEQGARLFARRPSVAIPVARALAQHGKISEAAAVLEGSKPWAAEHEIRLQIERLHRELLAGPARSPALPLPGTGR